MKLRLLEGSAGVLDYGGGVRQDTAHPAFPTAVPMGAIGSGLSSPESKNSRQKYSILFKILKKKLEKGTLSLKDHDFITNSLSI